MTKILCLLVIVQLLCATAEALLVPSFSVTSQPTTRKSLPLFTKSMPNDSVGNELDVAKQLVKATWKEPFQPHSKIIDKIFQQADSNNDGTVDLAETYELVLRMYLFLNRKAPIPPPTKEAIQLVFKTADVNRDNRIDREEFTSIMSILTRRAIWRLLSHKSVSFIGAPLLAESIVRLFHARKWGLQFITAHAPSNMVPALTSISVWRTVLLVVFVKSLGNLVLGMVNWLLDYSLFASTITDVGGDKMK